MAADSIINRYKKYITDKQRTNLRKLYKGYRQSTADELREQYLANRRSMGGIHSTASTYGLGEGYERRKKMSLDRSIDSYSRQLGASADASFEGQVVNAANATIEARNKAAQEKYERELAAAKEKERKQREAYEKYLKDLAAAKKKQAEVDKTNKKKQEEYEKALAAWKKQQKANANDKARLEKLNRQQSRNLGGKKLSKGLALTYYNHVYEAPTSTVPKMGKKNGKKTGLPALNSGRKGKGNALLSDQMYTYEDGGHTPLATARQGLNGQKAKPKYVDKKQAAQKAKQAVTGTISEPKLSIQADVPIPVAPEMEKDIVATVEATKPQDLPALKNDYLNAINDLDATMQQIQYEAEPLQRLQGIATEYQARIADASDTRKTPEQRRLAAQEARQLAHDYNATKLNTSQGSLQQRQAKVQQLVQTADTQLEGLQPQREVLRRLGVTMSDDEARFDANWLKGGNQLYGADNALVQQAQAYTTGNKEDTAELRQHLAAVDRAQSLANGNRYVIPPEEAAWFNANGYGWINTTPELLNITMQGGNRPIAFSQNVEKYLQQINSQSHSYQRQRNANTKLMGFSRMDER